MSIKLEAAVRLNALKQGIESKTGETYADLTVGVQALVDGYGQGGGGGGEVFTLIEKREYIHAEDWLSDVYGNSKNVYDVYFSELVSANPTHMFIAYFEGGTYDDVYMPNFMLNFDVPGTTNVQCNIRNKWTNSDAAPSANRSLWFSAGTKITMYEYAVRNIP